MLWCLARYLRQRKDAGMTNSSGFLRHVRACNNAQLPGGRSPFYVHGTQVGWIQPDAARLAGTDVAASDLPSLGRRLADSGLARWRDEAFDVRATPDGPVLGTIDRGALPVLGIEAVGVHLNGLVQRPDGLHLWVARRAADKKLDPGKLDHIVAGGVPAGLDPAGTLEKEAEEEAGLPPSLVARAQHRSVIAYTMDREEGLRRDRLHCYDLDLPPDFTPQPVDGEVEGFELWPIGRVLEAVHDTDDFKFNVNLVLIDLFLRLKLVNAPDLVAALRGV
jgi:8-oxo-dGTP pyrophosphatase MutT (NUDIX family)